jgi:hypothetical protein
VERLEDRHLPSTHTASSVSELVADINAANLSGGDNTIVLAAQTTFTLTAADNTTDGANGLPVIAARDSLTIVGNGDTIQRSTAAGTPAFRFFDVAAGGSLTLQNLTLQNGLAMAGGPTGDVGGAVYNQGTLQLSSATIANNAAPGAFDGSGGGIFNDSTGTLMVDASTLSGNSASIYGGAICNVGSMAVRDFSTLSGNSAGTGGAIANGGPAKLDQTILSGNSATLFGNPALGYGGAIDNSGTLTIQQCTLSDNSAVVSAGAILNQSVLTIQQSTLSGNSAAFDGGAIQNGGLQTIVQSTLSDNTAPFGAAILNALGTLTVEHSNLSGNSATAGSGGAIWNQATLTIDHCTLSGNSASISGGGIYNFSDEHFVSGTVMIESSTACDNSAPTGADLYNAGSATLQNSDVCLIDGSGALTTQ